MSTYWYFECLDHDPPLRLGEEFTQHTEDRAFWDGVSLIDQRPLADEFGAWYWTTPDGYFHSNAVKALLAHPHCRIGLTSDTGKHLEVQDLQQPSDDRR